jgi:uroporphyrin-III C-methyltransferase/precorrin-2 dehydrogenase/sirohydrochlorin ferrochelatase
MSPLDPPSAAVAPDATLARTVPPTPTRPARLAPLAVLPVFLSLTGKRAVVAGPSHADARHEPDRVGPDGMGPDLVGPDLAGMIWKVELLAAAGACVDVYTPTVTADLLALQAAPPAGCVAIVARGWTAADLTGAALAVGALDGAEAEAFATAAAVHGVPVNIVDTPALGTFNFGTIVNRAPLTIGISTEGAAPVVGQAVRARIEGLLHPAIGAWLARAKGLREAVKARLPMGPARRELWRRFADRALAADRPPTDGDLDALFAPCADGPSTAVGVGSVVLVGAGPGDPQLVTLAAVRALQSADVVMYDRLVGADILEMGRREATRILVGKTGGGRACRQADINDVMVRLAREGKRVVRLKGGDPTVFGRANEEIDACRAAGIPVEIVPGVSAAMAAAAALGLSLTDRRQARRLLFVTGHAEDGHAPEHDWPLLADPWTTTVFYMGGRTFAAMLPKLFAAGLAPTTPAIVVAGASWTGGTHVACPVADVPAALAHVGAVAAGAPTLILVGRAMAHSEALGEGGDGGWDWAREGGRVVSPRRPL